MMRKIFLVLAFLLLFLTACTKETNKNADVAENKKSVENSKQGEQADARQPVQPDKETPSFNTPLPVSEPRPGIISEDDLIIAGISIRDSYNEIVSRFGEPIEKVSGVNQESIHDPDRIIYWETWVYQGISFMFWSVREKGEDEPEFPDNLHSIMVESSEYETVRGVKVGNTLNEVFGLYGQKEIHYPNMNTFWYEDEFGFLLMEFTIANDDDTKITDKVIRIELLSIFD